MPDRVILEFVAGPKQGTRLAFERRDTLIGGRHTSCQLHLGDDPLVSRHHLLIEIRPPLASLRDLGSRNGTLVNGRRLQGPAGGADPVATRAAGSAVALAAGDRIAAGATEILVLIERAARCAECGSELPRSATATAARVSASPEHPLCDECRKQLSTVDRPRTMIEEVRCTVCGRTLEPREIAIRQARLTCAFCRGNEIVEAELVEPAPSELPAIAGYRLGKLIAAGGMGRVYHGLRLADRMQVAVKLILPQIAASGVARKAFLREIDVLRRLKHRHIVRLFECGLAGESLYMIMQYCPQLSLEAQLKRRNKPLGTDTAARLLWHCLRGLEYAHGRRIVHRDIKPANVLLVERGRKWYALLGDFGLAKCLDDAGLSGMTIAGAFAGTLGYLPREQLTGFREPHPTSDLWSLAATFFHATTGHLPLDFGSDRDPIEVILHDEPRPMAACAAHCDRRLAAILDRALRSEPAERFADAAQMRRAVEQSFGRTG